ncbi:MAG TPA: transaldolase [Dehalococcoidia bacterium]|nr:transaldolase [Dehalococcoidia bacterium]
MPTGGQDAVTNPLLALRGLGQSIWLDSLGRRLLGSGELARLLREDGVVGVTSNPAIFEKAIVETEDYDADIARLAASGRDAAAIYDELVVEDVRQAADLLLPVYEATQGQDGYVSLEVSPELAHDAGGTVAAVRRLWQAVGRPNLMVKIPGTVQGLEAIEACLSEGMNINVTLLFSVRRYEEVAWAYVRALERRAAQGLPVDRVASVASFFVSRVDTLVDRLLEERLSADPSLAEEVRPLLGKAGIANAKLAYRRFQQVFSGPRFLALVQKGARVQRCLWASTSTKNPAYSDVMYVEGLIGPQTVNTLPPATLEAFRDHGRVAATLAQGVEEAEAIIARLASLGIDIEEVAAQLEAEGVRLFVEAYRRTLTALAEKARRLAAARP